MRLFTAMRAFQRVADFKSFAAAARDLGVSTSSVSRHVFDLEEELGVRLFNRTTRRLSLTEAGEIYSERSKVILEDLEDLHSSTQDQQSAPSGRLRVTASLTLGEAWVVQLLPEFNKLYPDVFIELELTDRVINLVDEGFDVGVRTGGLKDSSMIARKLMDLNFIVYATPKYCEEFGSPQHPDDLKKHRCIQYLQPNHQNDDWWFDFGEEETWMDIKGVIAVNNAWAARELALSGMGIAYGPDFVVKQEIENGKLIRLLPEYEGSADPVHVVYPHKRHLSAKVRVFMDHLSNSTDIKPDSYGY
ncbi:MAG: LysR family transcriptional regulator [Rhodospirillales bacterium]|jgi:DNA-binding transcriptional LysR family regulator|nr:LysR family transcriptional regulator [Rhodospirillales bacterium]